MKNENKIILALDVKTENEALEICNATKDYVDAFKVGYPLVLNAGIEIIEILKAVGKPIIADFKIADIPSVSVTICRTAVDNGADYVIVHGFVGEEVIKDCSKYAKIFVVCEMSHEGARDFMEDAGRDIAEIAKKYAYGIVAPATRPERITQLREVVEDMVIISPGIKAQGAGVGDAIKAGADYEIIGRGIYQARDPGRAARGYSKILKRLESTPH
ncbi:MAG: orotidine-5'-phosphate decarboxylase [Candidatus Hydrothermarchaeales archaeon]